jgi:brefeldin A-inhibited guanine nucleotide-exchange protein
VRLES